MDDQMNFKFVTADDQSNIYACPDNGDLLYYRDEARDGTARWAFNGTGQKIGSGWGDFTHLVSGGDGVLYAITPNGSLLFYQDMATNGTSNWAHAGAGQTIGSGWF
jgi:hypothetical protein